MYDRFDFALLSFFSFAELATPFVVTEETSGTVWSVWQKSRRVGVIVKVGNQYDTGRG